MSAKKTPAFAVCGGISVETVVASAGRRRSSGKATKCSAVVGLGDSLYADLLWDCGGANVENAAAAAAAGTAFPTQEILNEEFSDVFGGPPKFATITSKLSCGMLATKLSRSKEMLSIECSARTPVCFDEPRGQTPLYIVQETSDNLTSSPSSAKFVKVRSEADVRFSSHVCYSDSDSKRSAKHKGDKASSGKEFSTTEVPSVFSPVRIASTSVKQKESSGLVGQDVKMFRSLKLSRNNGTSMKENVEEFNEASGSEQEDKLAPVSEKTAHYLSILDDRKQQFGHRSQIFKAQLQKPAVKLKYDSSDELWVNIRDVHCATEPAQFPPPSRPPPGLRSNAIYLSQSNDEVANCMNEWRNGCDSSLARRPGFDSDLMTSLNMKPASGFKNMENAVEIAEAKVKMVLEAREKAKLMVEKKLRDRRKAQKLKERFVRDVKLGKEDEGGKGNTKGRHNNCDMNKLQKELLRQRDIARQCMEKGTRELPNNSGLSVNQMLAESRFSPSSCEESREIKGGTSEIKVNQTTAHIKPNSMAEHFQFESGRGNCEQLFCGIRSKNIVEGVLNESREQQQNCLSSLWGSIDQKEFKKSNSEELDSISHTYSATPVLSGNEPFSKFPQQISGENVEKQLARLDRQCRTAARMEKALEEKRQRDLEREEEQAERQRAAEVLDDEIRVWAVGKEGNIEALLCSLHLILWPECGWKAVSAADLSTVDAVKKAYRRATLFVHPDKVQQRGATVAQKYVAEKVFDLLREASAIYK